MSALIELPCPESPRVSVIVTASARLDLLQACLRSVARCGPSTIPYETIVVLNRSLPHTEAQLRGVITGAHVISSPVNLGIAGSNNRGRHLARGELLLLLHDDTEVEPGWMEALVETADAHPHAGAIGGKVLFPDGQLQYAGSILWRDATTSPPWIGEAPAPDTFDRLRAVDYCGTSSLMVRASAWDRIGGADERLHPVYYVDVDLCMAIRQLGLAVLYQPACAPAIAGAQPRRNCSRHSWQSATGCCSLRNGARRWSSMNRTFRGRQPPSNAPWSGRRPWANGRGTPPRAGEWLWCRGPRLIRPSRSAACANTATACAKPMSATWRRR